MLHAADAKVDLVQVLLPVRVRPQAIEPLAPGFAEKMGLKRLQQNRAV